MRSKNLLWNDLKYLYLSQQLTWCYAGDFNVIIGQNDKLSGCQVKSSQAAGFEDFIQTYTLLESESKGSPYT